MALERLNAAAVESALAQLGEWRYVDGKLRREYRFASFVDAFGFMTMAALEVERRNHHPEWTNVYSRVDVTLWTHDAGGVTVRDVELAGVFEQIAGQLLG